MSSVAPPVQNPMSVFNPRYLDENGNISLKKLIGKGYDDFWYWRGRYRVIRGSRNSKKSWTTAFWIIINMMQMPLSNTLVIRKIAATNKNSTYAQLRKAISILGVSSLWKANESTLELTYKPTGQKIIFGGTDDPEKLSSITVAGDGVLCWMWVEEAFQISDEEIFDKIDQSFRGEMPPGYFISIMITFNPWNKGHWLKKRFFDNPDNETLAKHVNYKINEHISAADEKFFEDMRVRNPRTYQVAGLGNWGVSKGIIYTDWEERDFDLGEVRRRKSVVSLFGLDFGYTNDPTALVCMLLDKESKELYIFDEMYVRGYDNPAIAEEIYKMGYAKEKIYADSAEPKSIDELRLRCGINRIEGALKGKDSIKFGIQEVQQYHIVIKPKCVNFLDEIQNYVFREDPKLGGLMNEPEDQFNHLMDAMRYALMSLLYKGDGFMVEVKGDEEREVRLNENNWVFST